MNAIATTKRSKRVLSSMPVHEHRERLLAIRQQTVRVATPRGVLDAQIVKILRIDHRPLPSHQYRNLPVPQTRLLPTTSQRRIETPYELSNHAAGIVAPIGHRTPTECTRTKVGLRTVGEVLTDYDGHLYEVRDHQLHELGELVKDSRGRLFEVCQQSRNDKDWTTSDHKLDQSARTFTRPEVGPSHNSLKLKTTGQRPTTKKRDEIPSRYMDDGLKYSRDEALQRMSSIFATSHPTERSLIYLWFIYVLRFLKTTAVGVIGHFRLRRWQVLLKGKTVDDQLWGIDPPRGFSCMRVVRRWAKATLAQAGYEPNKMLLEWEIFWRRKGIK